MQLAPNAIKDMNEFWKVERKVWILEDANELKLKILIDGHRGGAGHRGKEPIKNSVCKKFEWVNRKVDVHEFVQGRLHYIIFRTCKRVPMLLATTLH